MGLGNGFAAFTAAHATTNGMDHNSEAFSEPSKRRTVGGDKGRGRMVLIVDSSRQIVANIVVSSSA
jgi:hypothetical protein